MKSIRNFCFEKQFIMRQYNEKWKFTDFNKHIKRLQCNHIFSFSDCQIPSLLQDNYEVPISTCKFSNKKKEILAVANENGIVCIQDVKKVKTLTHIQTHENTVYDIAWMPGNSQFVTVSGDNSAKLWDCKEANVNLISTFTGHKRSVKCVSFKPDNTAVFATGSRDGSLMIWDTRALKKCAKFSHHIPDQIITSESGSLRSSAKKTNVSIELLNSNSVTGLVFQNDNTLISCGSMDKFIKVWDMRKTYSRSVSNSVAKYQLASPKSGFSYLSMNTLGTKLYANCIDSYIYSFNINSYDPDPVAAFYGHENGSFYIKSSLSSDGLFLMSGSSDECAYIWSTRSAELLENAVKPIVILNSHTAEVTCVEMSPDGMVVVSCSDDGTFRLWNPFSIRINERDKVDIAACYDVENVTTVKTQWKNKRKFAEIEETNLDLKKSMECIHHSKICRFYTFNHSSPCICRTKFTQLKGEKRTNEFSKENETANKKRAVLEMQERTPPRQEDVQGLILPQYAYSRISQRQSNIPLKVSIKRKLEDMPNFIEESQKNKKVNFGVLTSLNSVDNSKNDNTVFNSVHECSKTDYRNLIKEGSSVTKQTAEPKNRLSALSSPTSNLPNYVEDGTSPYIHKCPKITQKENDWLTKFRKTCKLSKTLEKKPSAQNSTTLPSLDKRKKNKRLDHTLHKYFKVSSKATEKTISSQETQKKNVLVEL